MPNATAPTLDLTADIVDVRDIIARCEYLEDTEYGNDECADLWVILEALKGNGGDEKWRGDWYPVTLIRDSYFRTYAQELAEDIGAIDSNAQWPAYCIDWERAARELQYDYTSCDIDRVTYWYR
jgi:hypothetical protein